MTDEKIASSIRPKPSFGWLIIIGPVLIIVALSIFDGLPWVVDQSALGAEAEARSYTKIGRDMMKNRRYNDGAVQFNYAIKIKPD
ncbi:hypothetical protein K9N50_03195 [bacterium]|nr:hypothetical protein [bacterium]